MKTKDFIFGKSKYLVYEDGKVYSNNTNRFLKIHDNGKGYKVVNLCSNSIKKQFYLHRLVASCFIANLNNLSDVNHKDLDKSNNNVSNLEWCSRLENMRHAHENKAFINLEKKIKENHISWIGQKLGNREIIEVLEEKSKGGNYKVIAQCICKNKIKMYYNDFKKNKNNMQCSKCRFSKNKDKGEQYEY